jgi:hypothetical protein
MVLPPKVIHPKGDTELSLKKRDISALVADIFDGKILLNGIRKHKSPHWDSCRFLSSF